VEDHYVLQVLIYLFIFIRRTATSQHSRNIPRGMFMSQIDCASVFHRKSVSTSKLIECLFDNDYMSATALLRAT